MFYGLEIYDYNEARDSQYCWISAAQWAWPPWAPLMLPDWLMGQSTLGQWSGYEAWSVPSTRGWIIRVIDGLYYLSIILTDEKEKKEREPVFRARIEKILDNPFGLWESEKPKLKEYVDRLHPFDVKKASDAELAVHVCDCCDWELRMAIIHSYVMAGLGAVTFLFRDKLWEYTKIAPSDVKFSKLMSGFDNMLYHTNKDIAELGTSAVKLGFKNAFENEDPEKLPSILEKSEKGRTWLKQFNKFLDVWGMRPTTHGISSPTWIEKPSIPLQEIKRSMSVEGIHAPDRERKRLVKEREELEKEIVGMAPEKEQAYFRKLMKGAQAWGQFQEDHVYYCEFSAFSLLRRVAIEAGERLVKAGVFDEPEDAIYLFRDELVTALHAKNRYNIRDIMEKRKAEYQGYLKRVDLPMLVGNPAQFEESVHADPILAIGISAPIAEPEEVGATVVGAAGAPGVTEGTARVIMSINELDQVKPGEILVTLFTSPEWIPVFSVVKGLVTDFGGALSHTVIVSREYGIPAVVGTMAATAKIKTGQRIRVDGNQLKVNIVD